METDEALMDAYRLGDVDAFERLYGRHRAKVYGYLVKRCASRNTADEIFQGVFLKLHESRDAYDSNRPFLPWLFAIVRSVWTDRLRKDLGEKTKLETFAKDLRESESPPGGSSADSVIEAETPEWLASLPADQRDLLRMRYMEDLSFERIADLRGSKAASIRQALSRLTRKLRKGIEAKK